MGVCGLSTMVVWATNNVYMHVDCVRVHGRMHVYKSQDYVPVFVDACNLTDRASRVRI